MLSPRKHICVCIKPLNVHVKKVWGILVWHTYEIHYSSCDSTNHTPSTINCTLSPTPWNTSNLCKNIEQRSFDTFPVDWDSEDLSSFSISFKTYWLDLGLLQHVWALWIANKTSIHTSKVVLVYNIHSYTQSSVHTVVSRCLLHLPICTYILHSG